MPNRCQAPRCDYNYDSEIKKRESQEPEDRRGVFEYPKPGTDPVKRKQLLQSIPRDEWDPSEAKSVFLCEAHFRPEHVISTSTDSNNRRKRNKSTTKLKRKRLTDDAVPCIWPGAPEYLSTVTTPRPTTCSSSEAREENVRRHLEEVENARIARDTFTSLDELESKEEQLNIPDGVIKTKTDDSVLFFKLSSEEVPSILYSLRVTSSLRVTVSQFGEKVKNTCIRQICTTDMNTCTALNEIFNFFDNQSKADAVAQDIVDDVIEKLSNPIFDGNIKIAFIVEQLTLVLRSPNGRRYSPELLAMTCMLERISPSCYKQIYKDGFLTVPSPDHLRRLVSALDVDTLTLSETTVAYLKARYSKLHDREKVVSILMDEVYSQVTVQYVSGKFFGIENGQFTKTLLSVMLKSIAGKYRDIIVMAPVVNISAEKLYEVWKNVAKAISEIGFDIAVTMTDGHSSNMSFFNTKLLSNPHDLSFENEYKPGSKIFPMFDNTHLFKNFYNNWRNKSYFKCPSFEFPETNISPTFAHIRRIHEIEKGLPEKMAYKLTEKVLEPKVMEKTSVKLADAVFHESTINALNYYAENGYEKFKDSASFAKTVRDWFNTVNVKTIDHGNRKRDERRKPIRRDTVDEDLSYITTFVEWLERWKENGTRGLSNPTFEAAIRSCRATINLVHYLFDRFDNLEYILLGNISSDFLEGRFGWWRQMCGGNYYNSVIQFLQAEKTIRIRSLVSMGYNMKEIQQIFTTSKESRDLQQEQEIKCFINDLEDFSFEDDTVLRDNEKSILYYIAGYIAKSLSKGSCEN